MSMINHFPTWIESEGELRPLFNSESKGEVGPPSPSRSPPLSTTPLAPPPTLVPPLTLGFSPRQEDGWVDPVSWKELWLPEDLPLPLLRPGVAALIKDGVVRYLMPGLEVSIQAGGKLWWNRGMCSFPMALKWTEIGACDLAKLRCRYNTPPQPSRC